MYKNNQKIQNPKIFFLNFSMIQFSKIKIMAPLKIENKIQVKNIS